MFVSGPAKAIRYPDLVICNTRKVIGIVELKYQPRARPSWQKDVSTFHWIAEHSRSITISNRRFRGIESDSRVYPLSTDMIYVWAGVHAACDLRLEDHVAPELASQLLELHAETSRGQTIEIR